MAKNVKALDVMKLLTEMCMKDIGKMMKDMVRASRQQRMEDGMKEAGQGDMLMGWGLYTK